MKFLDDEEQPQAIRHLLFEVSEQSRNNIEKRLHVLAATVAWGIVYQDLLPPESEWEAVRLVDYFLRLNDQQLYHEAKILNWILDLEGKVFSSVEQASVVLVTLMGKRPRPKYEHEDWGDPLNVRFPDLQQKILRGGN